MDGANIALLVPRLHVKRVKSALEKHGLLDRGKKIALERPEKQDTTDAGSELKMLIYTTIPFPSADEDQDNESRRPGNTAQVNTLIADLGLEDIVPRIGISFHKWEASDTVSSGNALRRGLKDGLDSLPEELFAVLQLSPDTLLLSFPESYTVYKPMLLLPPNAFLSPPWRKLLAYHPTSSPKLQSLWQKIAAAVGATHIAVNAGIPLQTHTASNSLACEDANGAPKENVFRSPVNLVPIYGDFGPKPTPDTLSNPTASDFSSALWVSHTQNGIHQIWAPLYTMFSRGNIREKTRLLTLASVQSSVASAEGFTAVDLYAGIGYFAFSYRKAGANKVLCWELNPWSIEGLRRGAERNGWTTRIFTELPESQEEWAEQARNIEDVDFLVFPQSNEYALRPLTYLNGASGLRLPPIRHVNCGFLPSSKHSWSTAARMMDQDRGGWIHAHENVGVNDVECRKREVVAEFQEHVDGYEVERRRCGSYQRRVRCEHVERVKTYAPGVLHVVFDIWIDGTKTIKDGLA